MDVDMSEMQDLEKNAKEAYVKQRMDELGAYIEDLFADLELAHRRRFKHQLYFMASWGTWVASMFANAFLGTPILAALQEMGFLLFLTVLCIEWTVIMPHYFGTIDKIDSCLKTLEILGMLDKRDGGSRRVKKYKESWMYQFWQALKSQKMKEAFA